MGKESSDELEEVVAPAYFADDEFYRALAARPRRRLLGYLLEAETSTIGGLADVLCGWEATEPMVGPERHEQFRMALTHSHLPCLADAGLLQYDREEGTVELADLPPSVRDVIHRGIAAEQAGLSADSRDW